VKNTTNAIKPAVPAKACTAAPAVAAGPLHPDGGGLVFYKNTTGR